MKKILSTVLFLSLLVSLASCTTSSPEASEDGSSQTVSTGNSATLQEFQKTAMIEETVLYDAQDVRITATGLSYNNTSVDINLDIENNSNKDLSFTACTLGYSCNSVNGYMIPDGYLNCDVTAGKKANDIITFSYDALMVYGIFELSDIELGFTITDDDYNNIYTGPCPLKTSLADTHNYDTPYYREMITSKALQNAFAYSVSYFSDDSLYDQNGISIVSSALCVNKDDEAVLLLEIVNGSNETVDVTTSQVSVNGLGVYSGTWSVDMINPGKTCIATLSLSDMANGMLTEYGVKEVGTVSLSMSFKNSDGNDISTPTDLTITNPDAKVKFDSKGDEIYNDNDIRIISKGIVKDNSEYSDDLYLLLLVENNSANPIVLDDVYDSFSINGYMMDASMDYTEVKNNTSSVVPIKLWSTYLEENDITSPEEINSVEFSVEINNNHDKEIDKPTLNIEFKH